MFRAGGSFVLLSARNVALLWVRLHADLSTAVRRDNSGLFGTLRGTSGDAGGMQCASAFTLGTVVTTCHS